MRKNDKERKVWKRERNWPIETDISLQVEQESENFCGTILPRIVKETGGYLKTTLFIPLLQWRACFFSISVSISEDYTHFSTIAVCVSSNFSCDWSLSWFVPFPHSTADFFRDFTWIFIDFWEKLAFASLFSLAWNLEYFLLWIVRTAILGLQTEFSLFPCSDSYFYLIAILVSNKLSWVLCILVLILGIQLSGLLCMWWFRNSPFPLLIEVSIEIWISFSH